MKKVYCSLVYSFVLFSLCSCGSHQQEAPPPFTAGSGAPASSVASGESIYKRTCIACHQSTGEGMSNVYPPLAKSDFLANKEKTIAQVIKGQSGEITVNGKKYNNTMPPQQLNDEEIASVLTHVYNSFGNSGGTVTPDEVKAIRATLK